MFLAVHSDRSGRVFVSADYGAAALDGTLPGGLDRAIPLPAGARLVPLADRAAMGLDRRQVGAYVTRWKGRPHGPAGGPQRPGQASPVETHRRAVRQRDEPGAGREGDRAVEAAG
jgi:hypothetical protein